MASRGNEPLNAAQRPQEIVQESRGLREFLIRKTKVEPSTLTVERIYNHSHELLVLVTDFDLVGGCRADKGDTLKASYSHVVSPFTRTTIGTEISHKLSTKDTVSIGGWTR
ncbi:hypothetical protein SELMODRAFT_416586 [Selaginella moellendorffii]|uniref:Uncharacterized protein n=1 Tax=Selaginella moellendorffii TaxID=88036 RepID=D8RZS5_SELML|nr:hypothetical protein SELMODRAFT_416586 [Selaginella moellendorffii]